MSYFARFRRHEHQLFRLDTRIYLDDADTPSDDDTCVAAIIAKNPGSATPTVLAKFTPLTLDGDKLLPTVRRRFVDAYTNAQTDIPRGAFVRVWNLVYLCNARLADAITAFNTINRPLWCDTENDVPRVVWFAWGPPKPMLDLHKQRFLSLQVENAFYFDMDSATVVAQKPELSSRVKHTQGMPKEPIDRHLAKLIAG